MFYESPFINIACAKKLVGIIKGLIESAAGWGVLSKCASALIGGSCTLFGSEDLCGPPVG